jgi:pectate lyase
MSGFHAGLFRVRARVRALILALAAALAIAAVPAAAQAADAPWKTLLSRPDSWYQGAKGTRIVQNVLSFQSDQGSWPKNVDTTIRPYSGARSQLEGTFDNGATFGELRFLGRSYEATRNEACRDALLRGLDHVLRAQYPSGGWPQRFPPGQGYQRHITFNDGVMVNILELLRDVAAARQFGCVDEERRARAGHAFDSGIGSILRCQIRVEGRLTIWCAQHDEVTLVPRGGRSFEPAALTSAESAGVLGLLMSLDRPGPEIRQAVEAGARWFESSALRGIRQSSRDGDKVIVADPEAPVLWARFYEIGTGRPVFCGRDGVVQYELGRIERERRNGYAWYGDWGTDVARRYAAWKMRWIED